MSVLQYCNILFICNILYFVQTQQITNKTQQHMNTHFSSTQKTHFYRSHSPMPLNTNNLSLATTTQPQFPMMHMPYPSMGTQMLVSPRKLQHINCIIADNADGNGQGGLYIGDTISTFKSDIVFNNNIQAILCLNAEAAHNLPMYQNQGIQTKYLQIQDHIMFPISQYFKQAYNYIETNRKKGNNVLIQCHAGVSRSGTILCAYLMTKNRQKFHDVYQMVTKIRARIKPNLGFYQQLLNYQQQLFDQNNNIQLGEGTIQMELRNMENGQENNLSSQASDIRNMEKDEQIVGKIQGDLRMQTPKANRKGSFNSIKNNYYSDNKETIDNARINEEQNINNFLLQKNPMSHTVQGGIQLHSPVILKSIDNTVPNNSHPQMHYQTFYSPIQIKHPTPNYTPCYSPIRTPVITVPQHQIPSRGYKNMIQRSPIKRTHPHPFSQTQHIPQVNQSFGRPVQINGNYKISLKGRNHY